MGLSTDVKPTFDVPIGSKFTAVDTGAEFRFDGTTWYPIVDKISMAGSLASKVYAVTPSDTVDLVTGATGGLYVGVSGAVSLITAGGTTVVFTALTGGIIHPISVIRVMATGTTATGILAVY